MKRSLRTMLLTGLPPAPSRVHPGRARVAPGRQAGLTPPAQPDGDLFLLMRTPQDAATADLATQPTFLHRPVREHGVMPPRHAPGRSH